MLRVSDSSRFRLIDVLGQGGTATVARAWDRATRQYVAVKLRSSDADGTIETFRNAIRREYNLAGDIKAPGLVRILESPSPDYSSLIMELCTGRTLDTIPPIPYATAALNLISAVAIDLELLRVLGLVHGDIKPHNLYAPSHWNPTFADTLFWVKLSDFSLGRRIDESETARLGRGTIGHMAPETITGNTTSHRSDLFGLGITAYQVLTGRHPFDKGHEDPVAVNDRIRNEIPTPLKRLRPDISDEAAAALGRLLAKSPDERQQSAMEVCEALGRAGATYDYPRAIRPAHLIRYSLSYDDNVQTILRLDDRQAESLRDLTGERLSSLRLILTGTYLRGGLQYREGGFDVVGPWYQLRRRAVGSVASPVP